MNTQWLFCSVLNSTHMLLPAPLRRTHSLCVWTGKPWLVAFNWKEENPTEQPVPPGALLGVTTVPFLVLHSSTASARAFWPLRPGRPLAVDGPGPEISKLHTLALSTPLQKEHATWFPSESTEKVQGEASYLPNKKEKKGSEKVGEGGHCMTWTRLSFMAVWLLPVFQVCLKEKWYSPSSGWEAHAVWTIYVGKTDR